MPKISGIELCKTLKRSSESWKYVVMLTNKTGTDSVVEAMEAGADDFLTKPFVPEELRARIRAGCRIVDQEKKLTYLANFDALTGIWNRRMIIQQLEKEWDRAIREQRNLVLSILDLDHFKNINDTYGHDAGDKALQLFVETVKKQIRPYDSFGRYGGEEFLLVMPMEQQNDCLMIAERIRTAVSQAELVLEQDLKVAFTVSIGCASKRPEDKNYQDAILRADEAAYKAKNEGRNKVVFVQ